MRPVTLISCLFPLQGTDRRAIQLLYLAFRDNKRTRTLLTGPSQHFSKKLKCLLAYCYLMVKKINGIYYSKDRKTLMLYYRKGQHYFSCLDYLRYIYLAIKVIGYSRLWMTYQKEKRIQAIRQQQILAQQDPDYLYVWFLAQDQDHQGIKGLMTAKRFITNRAREQAIPIYMETTEKRLVQLYERMGFEFYDYMSDGEADLEIWFGRYQPRQFINSSYFLKQIYGHLGNNKK